MKNIYRLLAILLGYGIIIASFVIFGASLDDKIKILDIIVSCLVYTLFIQFMIFPLVNLNKSAHKEVGMMGIQFTLLPVCSLLAIGIIVLGIVFHLSFELQLIGQLIVLFVLLVGHFSVLHIGDKVTRIHKKEQIMMEGKSSLKMIMDDFMDEVACQKMLEPSVKEKLNEIHESLRFISPSANPEAKAADSKFIQSITHMRVMMKDTLLNKEQILEEMDKLERILSRRKKY